MFNDFSGRFGFDNPVNFNDNEVYCGGYGALWYKNSGKCGVCGDDWRDPEPRDHETGGRYSSVSNILPCLYTKA